MIGVDTAISGNRDRDVFTMMINVIGQETNAEQCLLLLLYSWAVSRPAGINDKQGEFHAYIIQQIDHLD